MALGLKGFCAYGRISAEEYGDEAELAVAELCLQAAVDHAKSAGIPVTRLDSEGNAKLELYIYALALHYFDNRGFIATDLSYSGNEYTERLMKKMRLELAAEGGEDGI